VDGLTPAHGLLLPNDMIYVPGSVGKTSGWGLPGSAPYIRLTRLITPF
jgi:hypothetical protein